MAKYFDSKSFIVLKFFDKIFMPPIFSFQNISLKFEDTIHTSLDYVINELEFGRIH